MISSGDDWSKKEKRQGPLPPLNEKGTGVLIATRMIGNMTLTTTHSATGRGNTSRLTTVVVRVSHRRDICLALRASRRMRSRRSLWTSLVSRCNTSESGVRRMHLAMSMRGRGLNTSLLATTGVKGKEKENTFTMMSQHPS